MCRQCFYKLYLHVGWAKNSGLAGATWKAEQSNRAKPVVRVADPSTCMAERGCEGSQHSLCMCVSVDMEGWLSFLPLLSSYFPTFLLSVPIQYQSHNNRSYMASLVPRHPRPGKGRESGDSA